jgi:hypothetical protein
MTNLNDKLRARELAAMSYRRQRNGFKLIDPFKTQDEFRERYPTMARYIDDQWEGRYLNVVKAEKRKR